MYNSSRLGVLAALTFGVVACTADADSPFTELTPTPPPSATAPVAPPVEEPVAKKSVPLIAGADYKWGLLSNPNFWGAPMKGAYFFAGSERDGTNKYQSESPGYVGPNIATYTAHPANPADLHWSDSTANQDAALKEMTDANVNTIVMSSWGARGTGTWFGGAPMQTSRWAEDELFDAAARSTAAGHPIVVIPSLENMGLPVNGDDLPTYLDPAVINAPAPDRLSNTLRARIDDMVQSYICTSVTCRARPGIVTRDMVFARMFDQRGVSRVAIHLYAACMNVDDPDGTRGAIALDNLAAAVQHDTGVLVGFTLDAKNAEGQDGCSNYNGLMLPEKGAGLATGQSVLAIQPFRSEVGSGGHNDYDRIYKKRDILHRWVVSGIPTFLDATPGYNGDIVFAKTKDGPDPSYGNNDNWRNYVGQLISGGIHGVVVNAWNGYTEGWASMPYVNAAWDQPNPSVDYAQWSWVRANFALDPRYCNHWEMVAGQPTYLIQGGICDKWVSWGGDIEGTPLGSLTSSEKAGGKSSRYNDFVNGRIYWANGAAHEVQGAIWAHYRDVMGLENGVLGLPTSDEWQTVHGRISQFEGGMIMWGDPGAHAVYGLIGAKYAQMGWDSSYLQLPTSEEQNWGGCSGGRYGRISQFQAGSITWCAGDAEATPTYWPPPYQLPYH